MNVPRMPELHVAESGPPDAPAIVFLHGIGASGWMWEPQVAALGDYHGLNVDLPGHGRSNQIAWVSLADTADQIAALIRSRAADRQAHVVGLSLGGYIALVLLERHADLVESLVISGVTAAPMPNRALLPAQVGLMSVILRRRSILNLQAKALGLPPHMQRAFADNFMAMSMETYRRIASEAAEYRLPEALERASTPVLVTAGSRESKIILEAVEVISKRLPNARGYLAPGGRHGWNVQDAALFNAMLRAWLASAPLPAALQAV